MPESWVYGKRLELKSEKNDDTIYSIILTAVLSLQFVQRLGSKEKMSSIQDYN